jgi:hypothetical protein
MPWNWSKLPVNLGGSKGTRAEAEARGTWASYEAEILERNLKDGSSTNHYNTGGLDSTSKGAYLDKVTGDYKQRAQEALKAEFSDWLQGKHEDNFKAHVAHNHYKNDGVAPTRRYFYRDKDMPANTDVSLPKDDWFSTPWGRQQLTHLPGVRDYLRNMAVAADNASYDMNLLAEHGPQNLNDAWMYFKHWVKRRPVNDPLTLNLYGDNAGDGTPALLHGPGGNTTANKSYTAPGDHGNLPDDPKYEDYGDADDDGDARGYGYTDDEDYGDADDDGDARGYGYTDDDAPEW